jgi:hypothetical protein
VEPDAQLQYDTSAPAPQQPIKKSETLEAYDQLQSRRPPPLSGPARYVNALRTGGVLGVIGAALDKDAPQREQYAMDQAGLMNRQKIQHQDTQDELNGLQKQAYRQNIENQSDDRKIAAQDRGNSLEAQMLERGITPVGPGEVADQRYEYFQGPDGKQRKRLTQAAIAADKQAAKMGDWVTVTPEMEQQYGQFGLKAGQKVDPMRVTQLIGFAEANGRAREANELRKYLGDMSDQTRREMASQSNETRRVLGSMAHSGGRGGVSPGADDGAKIWADNIKAGRAKIEQVPKELKTSVMREMGVEAPRPLSSTAARVVSEIDPTLKQIQRLKAKLEPLKDNDTPGYFLPDRVAYAAGRAGTMGGDIADLSMAGVSGAARILKGTSRAKAIFNRALEHTPNVWVDSPKNAYEKLSRMEANISDGRNAAVEEGDKYGVSVSGPAAGGGNTSFVVMKNPKTGKTEKVKVDYADRAKSLGWVVSQ